MVLHWPELPELCLPVGKRSPACRDPLFHESVSFSDHVRELSLLPFSIHLVLKVPSDCTNNVDVKNSPSKGRKKSSLSLSLRSLGVTLWELFDSAAQPYSSLSNLDVLNRVIRERDTKLPKPQLEQPYSDRWLVTSCFCFYTVNVVFFICILFMTFKRINVYFYNLTLFLENVWNKEFLCIMHNKKCEINSN